MKHLKLFENKSQYDAFKGSAEYVLPNVSFCIEEKHLNFKKLIQNKISGTFTISEDSLFFPIVGHGCLFFANHMAYGKMPLPFDISKISTVKIDNNIVEKNECIIEMSQGDEKQYVLGYRDTNLSLNEQHTFEIEFSDKLENETITFFSTADHLDLSKFDTSNFTKMDWMFFASQLKTVNLNGLNTSNVTDMSSMFSDSMIISADLTNCDISNVTNMDWMFFNCYALEEVYISGDPKKLINANGMFNGVKTNGKLYFNAAYDYSKIFEVLPDTWSIIYCELINGKLVPLPA